MKSDIAMLLVICIMALGVQGDRETGKCPEWILFDGRYDITAENNVHSIATRPCHCWGSTSSETLSCFTSLTWSGRKCSCADAGYCFHPGEGYKVPQGLILGSVATQACENNCTDGSVGLIKRRCRDDQSWSNPSEKCRCYDAWKKVGGDCWEMCDHEAGSCSQCGVGGFCCRKGRNDEGCTEAQTLTAGRWSRHVCIKSSFGWNMHVLVIFTNEVDEHVPGAEKDTEEVDCLVVCGHAGRCSACDSGPLPGYCCKNGEAGCTAIQKSVAIDREGRHVCVANTQNYRTVDTDDCSKYCPKGRCNKCDFGNVHGYCCKRDDPTGCTWEQRKAASKYHHVCVAEII